MRIATALALAAIRFYQRFISPMKGFSCALRVGTGGASCSAYGHAVIARFGVRRGIGLLQRRFEVCGHVYRRMHGAAPPPHPRLKYQRGHCDGLACDGPCDHGHCLSADTAFDALGCAGDAADCGSSSRRKESKRTNEELEMIAERIRQHEARMASERR